MGTRGSHPTLFIQPSC